MMFIHKDVSKSGINQKGSVTAISLFFVIFIGIIFAGLLPLIGVEYKAQASNRDAVQASLAADGGAKRAYEVLAYQQSPIVSWTDSSTTNFTAIPVDPNNQTPPNSSGTYHVQIYDGIILTKDYLVAPGTALSPNHLYTIKSFGDVDNIEKVVTMKVTTLPAAVLPPTVTPPNVSQLPYIALSGTISDSGDTHTLTISNGVKFTNSGVLGSMGNAWNNYGPLPLGVTLQLNALATYPSIPIPWETSVKQGQTTLNDPWGSSYTVNSATTLN